MACLLSRPTRDDSHVLVAHHLAVSGAGSAGRAPPVPRGPRRRSADRTGTRLVLPRGRGEPAAHRGSGRSASTLVVDRRPGLPCRALRTGPTQRGRAALVPVQDLLAGEAADQLLADAAVGELLLRGRGDGGGVARLSASGPEPPRERARGPKPQSITVTTAELPPTAHGRQVPDPAPDPLLEATPRGPWDDSAATCSARVRRELPPRRGDD